MTTLFDNAGLPLWVYIVIISVGSILVLAAVAVLLRCWCLRRRANEAALDGLTGPTRRVTLRRGRMVPTSQHLSLTGSKFGMRQFGILADNESTMTGRRSPFEWWNTILERSQSRTDQMSQLETGSFHTRSGSRATTIVTRRELMTATPTQTPEKNKEPTMRTWELTIPSPSPSPTPSSQRPSQTTNFSRSFVPCTPSSPLTQRSQTTLSRIEERSPHHSMISAAGPKQINRSSYYSAIHPLDNTPLAGQVPEPNPSPTTLGKPMMTLAIPPATAPASKRSPTLPKDRPSPPSLIPGSNRDPNQFSTSATITTQRSTHPPRPSTADAATSSPKLSSTDSDTHNIPIPSVPSLPILKPVAYRNSRSGFGDALSSRLVYRYPNQSQLDLTHRESTASRRDSTRTSTSLSMSLKSSVSNGPSGIVYESQIPDFWSTRTDLHDLPSTLGVNGKNSAADSAGTPRIGSSDRKSREGDRDGECVMGVMTVPGKNNSKVLRKKSLKRTEMVSSMGT